MMTAATHRSFFLRRDEPERLLSRYALWVTAMLVAMVSFQIAGDFIQRVTIYGTSHAPHSDALAPWLHGALNYLFYGEPHSYLYRPTIGVFFGSVVAATNSIYAIPIFFAVLPVAFLLLAIPQADQELQLAFLAWLFIAATNYTAVIQPLNVANLMPDVPAFAFSLIGLYFILVSVRGVQMDPVSLLIGFLAIGIAATMRGAMLVAGPAMLLLLYVMTDAERRWRPLVLASMAFLLPILIDVVSQRVYGVINNGVMTMYCFYTEPSYTWTTPCQNRYLDVKPTMGTILQNYLQTLLSEQGLSVVKGNLGARIHAEGQQFHSALFWGTFLVVALWQCWGVARRCAWNAAGTIIERFFVFMRSRHFTPTRIVLVTIAGLVAYRWGPPLASVMAFTLAITLISLVLRLYRPMLMLIAYWVGAVFLALMTQAQQDRLGLTFSFALYLAIFLCIWDQPRVHQPDFDLRAVRRLGISTIVVLMFLYSGVFLIPSPWKVLHKSEVDGRAAALKISEDRTVERCLYYTGNRQMVYVKCDDASIGSVRQYSRIEAPEGLWNQSYWLPARFVP